MGVDFLGGSQPGAVQSDNGSGRPAKRFSVETGIDLKNECPFQKHFGGRAFPRVDTINSFRSRFVTFA